MNIFVAREFNEITCVNCGCLFALEHDFKNNRVKDHKDFYCPNGHSQIFVGETAEEKLRKELAREISIRNEAQSQVRKLEWKIKRTNNGICSECNRSFVNLQRHMKTKHHHGGKI